MKTLKITLVLALFLTVSSQTDKTPQKTDLQKEVNTLDTTKPYYDLLAHSRDQFVVPTRG
ncbi:hypothetical protein ES711_03675 [Gelidibacter salicanalis]|uniref:Uncharacterized protein n=1 Tax=Gelidibacter salicanalis TaxID=291193 RepID=A0A5C7AM83_9FLAO|nr:hypothetical protein [Gelidibacter salicanalis]TXE09044.1 hypothetical protein ES711_03675 [Gelidibacter salicanalis]